MVKSVVYAWVFAFIFALAIVGTVNAEITGVGLSEPGNTTWTSELTPDFSFIVNSTTDDNFTCTLIVDSIPHGTNTTVLNNTLTTITANESLQLGVRTWLVSCDDSATSPLNSDIHLLNVDNVDPYVTVFEPVNLSWFDSGSVLFNFSVFDGLSSSLDYLVFLDGLANASGTVANESNVGVLFSGLSDGEYDVLVQVSDLAGNSVNSSLLSFYVDTVDPIVTVNSPANGSVLQITPTLNFTISDNIASSLDYVVFVNGSSDVSGSVGNNTTVIETLSPLSVGVNIIIVQVTDEAGNNVNSSSLTVIMDDSAPTVSIAAPANASWFSVQELDITVLLTDAFSSTINYTVFVNGVSNVSGVVSNDTATNITVSGLPVGSAELVVEAVNDGGFSANSTMVTLFIDVADPAVVINSPVNASWFDSGSFDLNFTASDDLAGSLNYVVFLNGASNVSGSLSNDSSEVVGLSDLSDGSNVIVVQVSDLAGNSVNSSVLVVFVDTVDPSVVVTSPANASWFDSGSVFVNFTVSDDLAGSLDFVLFLDGVLNESGSASNGTYRNLTIGGLADGEHVIIVQVSDLAGNAVNGTAVTFTVDTVVPVVTINSPSNGSVYQVTPQLNFTSTDALSTNLNYVVFVNGTSDGSGTATNNTAETVTLSPLSAGLYSIIVQVTDDTGNAVNSTNLIITMDGSAPTATITLPANGSWHAGSELNLTILLTDSFSSEINYTVYINSAVNATGSATNDSAEVVLISGLNNNAYEIIVEALNEGGFRANSTAITIFADSVAPVVNINTPDDNAQIANATPTISFYANDFMAENMTYMIFVDDAYTGQNGNLTNFTGTEYVEVILSSLSEGNHTYIVEVTDIAGNSQNSTTRNLIVDLTAPVIALHYPADSATVETSNVTLNFTMTDSFSSTMNYTLYLNGVINTTETGNNDTLVDLWRILPNGAYTWYVIAIDSAGNNITSSVNNFTVSSSDVPTTAPVLGQSGVSDSNDDGNINLNWTSDPNAVSYRVYRSNENITDATGLIALANVSGTAYNDTSAVHGEEYWYAVTSVNLAGNENKSIVSDSFSATSNDTIVPTLTSELNATNSTDGSITISWDSVSLDVEGNVELQVEYWVFRTVNLSELNTSTTDERITTTSLLNYTDTNITTNETYTYVVTTIDDGNNHNNSIIASNQAEIEATECSTEWSAWSAWSACSGGQQSRTRTRTCYGGGETVQTETQSCTISSGGGGGSGSFPPGIGVASQVSQGNVNFSRAGIWFFSGIRPNEQNTLDTSGQNMTISQIRINARSNVNNLEIRMGELVSGVEPTRTKPQGKLFKYIEITANQDIDDSVESIVFEFSVPLEWIGYQEATPRDVKLYRLVSSAWIPLKTTLVRQEGGRAYYEAVTSGLSYFAITSGIDIITTLPPTTIPEEPVSEPIVEDRIPVQEEVPPTIVPEEPVKRGMGLWAWFGIFVLLAVIVTAGILFFNKTGKSEYEKFKDELKEDTEKPKEQSHKKKHKK